MTESILTSIKKLLGIPEDHEHFDEDIIMNINSVFMILTQLGVGPSSGFKISDKTTTWDEYIQDTNNIESVKSYVYYKVKLLFDPPTGSAVMESINRIISELEWRLNVEVETATVQSQ